MYPLVPAPELEPVCAMAEGTGEKYCMATQKGGPTSIPLFDLKRQHGALKEELSAAFERVLASGMYILGEEVAAFEREAAAYIGCRHAVGVASGSEALLIAMMALGIGPGDEVICPTYTFFATAGSVRRLGARPVWAEIDPVTFNVSPEDIARRISSRTRAIIPVHLFGQCADMEAIMKIAASGGIPVIEDAAQAIGTPCCGRMAGAVGSIGCISFFPTKNLGALGDAGMIVTDDHELAEKCRMLRTHGMEPKYFHKIVGLNGRIDALQCAFLRVKLKRLDGWIAARRRNAALYRRLFDEMEIRGVEPPVEVRPGHTYNQFVVRVPGEGRRDALRKFLAGRGIGTEIYYPVPLHMQECFADLGGREGDFPESERAARETLALPIFPELTEDEIRYVAEAIAGFAAA
ncbi:MAG: DegT/DnrJ/EryC1/StrS family aminotransferase [Planctomycetota bacterium]|nr:DegT/DnrJ/EryC1/StrS family aminotransferase [Planctomycetota bacterium]